jgi:ribosomal protein S18 acetylase RimI-like enzyme
MKETLMPDMLVKLYDLDDDWSFIAEQKARGITIRKALGTEYRTIPAWAGEHFSEGWAGETEKAMSNNPITCFVAVKEKELVGFGCYDSAALGYFGPLGVCEDIRGQGTGKALLLACLLDMKLKGYGYAIIGWTGILDFYAKAVGAVEIPDSAPGIWKTMVWPKPKE